MSFDIGGNGGTSFRFDSHGDTVTGKILSIEEVQQTDPATGKPQFWDDYNTQPKMQYRVTLATDLRSDDPADDGHRAIYLKGSRKPESKSSLAAVLQAVRAATGGTSLDTGGWLQLTYISDGAQANRAFSAPKQYEAKYQAPQVNLGQPAAPASQPSAPAPQQQYQPWNAQQPVSPQSASAPQQGFGQPAQPAPQPPF